MSFKMKYTIEQDFLPNQTKRRSGNKNNGITFIVAHDTGNDGSTAANNVNYYRNSATTVSASAHTFIDDKRIIECIPLHEKAWHVLYSVTADNKLYGANANDSAIGVELCYSYKKGNVNNKEAYKKYVWYLAYLCYQYKLDPALHIVGHNELDPKRKLDPYLNALKHMGITKKQFLHDIVVELSNCMLTKTPEQEKSEDDEPMKLQAWQKSLFIDGIKKFAKEKGIDGNTLINSPEAWIKKVEDETLTASDMATLNFAILVRTVK